ncbi:MAG: amino acid permease [Chlamydiales bacterium]|nr:amino acid permease [Chlamydiales bacterium]
MFNVSLMASLRNLPLVSELGLSALFFFTVVGIGFLIPAALVSAELATGWPKSGGIYIWVREAFGDKWGFFAIWMQWIHNVTWFPAILSFVAATLAYIFNPELASSKIFILCVVLSVFWGMTLFNYLGIKLSSLFSTVGVIAGTIIPGLLIIFLGISWVASNQPSFLTISWDAFIPDLGDPQNLVFMGGLFLAFAGLEVSAAYAGEVKDPQKNYPRAIIIAALITFFLFMLGSLSIAVVIPKSEISLVSGLMEAFQLFLVNYNLAWFVPILAMLLVFGAVAEVNSWIIGPVKALYTTSLHGNLPPIFQKQNRHNMPVNLLLFQAIIVTIAACVILFMPSISAAYWILTALSAQLYLVMYLTMFAAAIKLRYSKPHVPRAYKIPHPHKGMWIVACVGMFASIFAITLSFLPPSQLAVGNLLFYELFLLIGFGCMIALPFVMHAFRKPEWMKKIHDSAS